MSGQGFRRLQEQYNDPLLTALAVMLVVLFFVVGPLQATGVVAAHQFRHCIWAGAGRRGLHRIQQQGGARSHPGRRQP